MAIVMQMSWPGLTTEQYDQARQKVGWEEDPPAGGHVHVAWFDDGLHVIDVWDSMEAFDAFAAARLMPVLKGDLAFEGDPEVKVAPLHRLWDARHRQAMT